MSEQFYTILTLLGLAEDAVARSGGPQVSLTHVVLGDGNGNYYEPSEGQTSLVREVYRTGIGSVSVDPNNAGGIIVEAVVPANVGGWWLREGGVISATGNLFAVGKFPATYKPLLSEGAGKELLIKMVFAVSNASSITITTDPAMITATKADIAAHDTSETAHSAIRAAIQGQIQKVRHETRRMSYFYGGR